MDWIKKNLMIVIGSAVALVAVGASGYFLMVQMGKYEQAGGQMASADSTVNSFVTKSPHPGASGVDNIKAVKDDIQRLEKFKGELTSTFKSIPLGGNSEQAFKSELAETLAYIEREGKRVGLTAPTNFNLSFTAQKVGFRFASNSLAPLRVQLADLREITKILVEARVNTIDSYRRVAVSADDSGPNAVENEYLTNLKIATNEFTGAIVHPYEITFRCFSEEFGEVLEGIAASPYSIIVKTVSVEPGQVRNIKPLFASAEEVFGAALGGPSTFPGRAMYGTDPNAASAASPYGGRTGRRGEQMSSVYGGGAGGRDARAASVYGGGPAGGRDARAASVYGGGGARAQRPAGPAATVYGAGATPAAAALPTGPETTLTERPIKVTLGLAVIRMQDKATSAPVTN